jgi:hypothetical protein
MPFSCSICGEESTRICVRCTKDACNNHLCEKCLRCSDCCECEVMLTDNSLHNSVTARSVFAKHEPDPKPEPPHPPPDPDPFPEEPEPAAE